MATRDPHPPGMPLDMTNVLKISVDKNQIVHNGRFADLNCAL